MNGDTWIGIIIGGLVMTFVWGVALMVVIAAIGAGQHTQVDGGKYTGPGSDADE